MTLDPTELAARYALLCRSTQATAPADDSQALRVGPHLSALRTLLQHDLRALGRQGSPDDFADICFELDHELERFEEFCAFPALAQKFVVAFGGGLQRRQIQPDQRPDQSVAGDRLRRCRHYHRPGLQIDGNFAARPGGRNRYRWLG